MMTGEQFSDALAKLATNKKGAAVLLGVNRMTIWRWENGVEIPQSVELLLAVMIKHKITPAAALKLINA